jgi:hypothetical protein
MFKLIRKVSVTVFRLSQLLKAKCRTALLSQAVVRKAILSNRGIQIRKRSREISTACYCSIAIAFFVVGDGARSWASVTFNRRSVSIGHKHLALIKALVKSELLVTSGGTNSYQMNPLAEPQSGPETVALRAESEHAPIHLESLLFYNGDGRLPKAHCDLQDSNVRVRSP